jgi:uncharacterized membrane protein
VIFGKSERSNNPAINAPRGVDDNARIGGFSDGVFSITITLLVLELHVPEVEDHGLAFQALLETASQWLGYIISIVVIGIYWVGQHNMYFHIKRHDRVMLWLNILFLGLVATMPFWTDFLRHYSDQQIAVVMYAGVLALIGLTLDTIWRYASDKRRLVDPNIDPQLVAFIHRRVLIAPVIYLASIALSFINVYLAEALFALVAVLYIFPNPLDHYHHRALGSHASEEVLPTED